MSADVMIATKSQWMLVGQLADDEPVRTIRVDKSPFVIGRRDDVSLPIPALTISGRHAELLFDDNCLKIRDLGSTNGTFVNGVRISEAGQLNHGDIVQFAQVVFRVSFASSEYDSKTVQEDSCDRALALIQFDKLISDRAVQPHIQPIVTMDGLQVIGYEILGRSRLFGLTDPESMFSAAAVLDMECELSRILREEGVRSSSILPAEQCLFANTHPAEMVDLDLLIFSLRGLRESEPNRPLVLEIHESAVARKGDMTKVRQALKELDIKLAYDDFGAGQARLIELAEVAPDYLKFDMQLIQGIADASSEHQKMLAGLVEMVRDLGIAPLAEGIEVKADHEVCQQLGFEYAQGFYYARPALPRYFKLGPSESTH
jgi:EAL domain-containing protein (putative c-di-GMP-specific phosphodiesterase class I)